MQQYLSTLEKSWFKLYQHYHFSEPQKVFNKLIAAYSEKHRAYHTIQHLYECLVLVDSIRADLNDAHAWLDTDVYSIKRKQVLAHFYQTEPLYQTEYFQQSFEYKAKHNLSKILEMSNS